MPFDLTDEEVARDCDLSHYKHLLNSAFKNYMVSHWSQAGRQEAGDGVCMGMCLDWIRRILTGKAKFGMGGSAVFNPKVDAKKKEASRFKKVIETHGIYARVQSEVVAQHWHHLQKDRALKTVLPRVRQLDPALAAVDTLEQAQREIDDKLFNQGGSIDHAMDVQQRFEALLDEYTREVSRSPTGSEGLELRLQHQQDILQSFSTVWTKELPKTQMSLLPPFWSNKPRTHSFQNIRVRRVGPLIAAGQDGLGASLSAVEFLTYLEFQVGCLRDGSCGVLSISPLGSPGHDVAFHTTNGKSVFYFFDPNLGEYLFPEDQLMMLGLLLWAGWRAIYQPRGYDSASWVEYTSN